MGYDFNSWKTQVIGLTPDWPCAETNMDHSKIVNWCVRNVGPKTFHLHTGAGGTGWRIIKKNHGYNYPGFEVFFEDELMLSSFLLETAGMV